MILKLQGLKLLNRLFCATVLLVPVMASAAPATFTENNRRMVTACVDPQINGQTALRKKDGEPKTHTLTFQFSADYRQAGVIGGSRVAKTGACTAVFNLVTGMITDQVSIDGQVHDVVLQFTGGFSFSVVEFPLPMVA